MSELESKKKKASSSSIILKKLKVEKKRSELLKKKQLKTLKLLKLTKAKLEKYKRAYSVLKKKKAVAPVEDTSQLKEDFLKSQERLSKTLGLLKDARTELKAAKVAALKSKGSDEAKAKLKEATAKLKEVESALQETSKAREAAEKQCQRLEKERSEQTGKLAALAESFSKMQDALADAQAHDPEIVVELEHRVDELEQELQEAHMARTELEKELNQARELAGRSQQLEAAKAEADEALEQVRSQLKTRETEHEEALLKLWDLEERITNEGSNVSGALEAKNAEIEDWKKKALKAEEQLTAEESEKEKALARLNESRDEAARLEAESKSLSQELDQSKERIAVLMSAGQNLKSQMAELNAKHDALQAEYQAQLEAMEKLKTEHQTLQQTAAPAEDENREPAEQRAGRAEARLKEVEEQLVETRSRLLNYHAEREEIEKAKLAVEERNEELQKEVQYGLSQLQQLESLISLLEQREETHNRQLAAMRRQITELLEDNNRLKEDVSDKSGRLKNVERSFEETDESLTNLRRRYETTREALEAAKDQLTEARNRALLNLGKSEEAERQLSKALHDSKVVGEENKVLKRRLERLQERIAELEMLS